VGDLTIRGSYTGSASPYGTFDQGGNVAEWNEAILLVSPAARGKRGGSFLDTPSNLAALPRNVDFSTAELEVLGFRVAMVPEPGTGLLVMTGLLGLVARRQRHA
jgi:hypothetical protein